MNEAGFEQVSTMAELPEGTPVGVELSTGESVCLVRVNGDVYAFQNRCTHAEFPLSEGDMVDDYVIECGLHGAQFDVRTGEVREPPATDELPRYEVKVEGDAVWVRPKE